MSTCDNDKEEDAADEVSPVGTADHGTMISGSCLTTAAVVVVVVLLAKPVEAVVEGAMNGICSQQSMFPANKASSSAAHKSLNAIGKQKP